MHLWKEKLNKNRQNTEEYHIFIYLKLNGTQDMMCRRANFWWIIIQLFPRLSHHLKSPFYALGLHLRPRKPFSPLRVLRVNIRNDGRWRCCSSHAPRPTRRGGYRFHTAQCKRFNPHASNVCCHNNCFSHDWVGLTDFHRAIHSLLAGLLQPNSCIERSKYSSPWYVICQFESSLKDASCKTFTLSAQACCLLSFVPQSPFYLLI